MASETSVSDQTADVNTAENKVTDDIKNVEDDSASQPKEIGGSNEMEKLKVEETESSETPVTESEENTGGKNDEIPVVLEVKKEDEEDKVSSPKTTVHEPDKKPEDKKDDIPAVEEVKNEGEESKVSDFDVSVGDGSKEVESCKQESNFPTALEPAAEVDEIEPYKKSTNISKQSNEPEIQLTDVSEPSNDKPMEESEVPLIQESQPEVGRETEVSESVTEIVKSPDELKETSDDPTSASESAIKPEKQMAVHVATESASKDIGEVDKNPETSDAIESADTSKDENILADEVETGPASSTEEPSAIDAVTIEADSDNFEDGNNKVQETAVPKSFNPVAADTTEVSEVKENGDGSAVSDIIEKADVDPNANESVKETNKEDNVSGTVEGLLKEEAVDVGLPNQSSAIGVIKEIDTTSAPEIAESFVKPMVKVEEDKEEGTVETNGSTPTDMNKIDDLGGSNSANEVIKIFSEKEKALEGVENVVEEQKDKSVKDDMTSSIQNFGDIDVEGRTNDTDTSAMDSVDKSKVTELEVQREEPTETIVDKSENEETEKKEENDNTDAQNFVESSKDGNDPKTDAEAPKPDIPAKPSQRQSNNIISKVKQSIVKVKKAIIGKSSNSKTISSEPKDDIKGN